MAGYIINGFNGIVETAILIGNPIYSSAALANIDADDYLEVVVGSTDRKVYCFQWDGTEYITETGMAF